MKKYFTDDNKWSEEERLSNVLWSVLSRIVYLCLMNKKLDKLSIDEINKNEDIKDGVKEIAEYIHNYYIPK